MPEKDYSHRTNVQKLGVKPDERLEVSGDVGPGLRSDLKEALGRGLVRSGDLDGAIVMVGSLEEGQEALVRYRARLQRLRLPVGLTYKRGHENYLNQMSLVPYAKRVGLIDNKTSSIDDDRSGIRFVVPRALRSNGSGVALPEAERGHDQRVLQVALGGRPDAPDLAARVRARQRRAHAERGHQRPRLGLERGPVAAEGVQAPRAVEDQGRPRIGGQPSALQRGARRRVGALDDGVGGQAREPDPGAGRDLRGGGQPPPGTRPNDVAQAAGVALVGAPPAG